MHSNASIDSLVFLLVKSLLILHLLVTKTILPRLISSLDSNSTPGCCPSSSYAASQRVRPSPNHLGHPWPPWSLQVAIKLVLYSIILKYQAKLPLFLGTYITSVV